MPSRAKSAMPSRAKRARACEQAIARNVHSRLNDEGRGLGADLISHGRGRSAAAAMALSFGLIPPVVRVPQGLPRGIWPLAPRRTKVPGQDLAKSGDSAAGQPTGVSNSVSLVQFRFVSNP